MRVKLLAEPARLEADPTRLEQVLTNLINNAAKYTEPGGQISISAQRLGNELMVAVRDSGIGIVPEALPHIFDLFVQGQNRSDLAQGGLGIGLTLVRRLVEMHGGRVSASSSGVGQGSEFRVYLPLLPDVHQNTTNPQAAPHLLSQRASGSSRRILVVDDNVDAAKTFSALLEHENHQVHIAHEGTAALELVSAVRPDIVFLDIGLPEINGFEVARRIRQQPGGDRLFLVALTGWGTDDDRRRSQEAGFDLHMVKPLEPSVLHTILQHPRLSSERDSLGGGTASNRK